ncbi:MAG: sigma-54-dependent Fis family transcriptional regulator [Deltaproteobacteria bacterium]|nr:MAG: sigma-54-dependent Fis family transcriptional regulator [Deltaproteobacteria bacterium]
MQAGEPADRLSSVARFALIVRAGPDAGASVIVDTDTVVVGRGEGSTLQLTDAAVSRRHLVLRRAADRDVLEVAEVPGVNPVWSIVDGQRIGITPGTGLAPGASFTLGNTTIQVADAAAGPKGTLELDVRTGPAPGDELASLAALGERLAQCGSLQAVFRTATSWAVDALPCDRALVLSADGSDVLGAAADGPAPDLALSRAILHRVRTEQRAFLVRDVAAEPDLAGRQSIVARGIRGAMAAPVRDLVFYAEWSGPKGPALPEDRALLLLVCAAQLVAALGTSATERSQLRAAARSRGRPAARMVGASAPMQRLQVFLERVAQTQATVLLLGESGTGKELAANLIHALSPRSSGPFVAINCAAIPENLLESELFGHERGAFTGAVAQHDGVFARAHGGTLFLDEIGEMSLATQARMLRVLETRRFTRVGGTEEIEVDVRLVAATHRDLRKMVAEGRFREDLLYRLSVIQTRLPPLRERVEDIPELVRYFADELGESMGRRILAISPEALEILQRYRWPGNVRELRNVVERALVLGDGPTLEADDLPPELHKAAPTVPPTAAAAATHLVRPLAELERDAIAAALEATGGNKARAAALLGIDRTTLYRKLKDMDV